MHRKQQQLRLELMEEDSDSFQHTCKAISARQLRSLSLQTGLAAESDQLHTAIGRPPSYSLPGATNKANLWDMAPYASSMPDLQNMCVVPRLPSPSEQSCHSHQSSEYSLSENGSGPLSSHPPPTHSNWLDSQADNRILRSLHTNLRPKNAYRRRPDFYVGLRWLRRIKPPAYEHTANTSADEWQ
ncbi:hypothetical protein NQZ68_039944 [Dissostichus eleginoides]|nr:hypothetical protein NQZ68_039944 [Dissostichus eleginoides]